MLTREENVFLAKRNLVDTIWRSARLEGIACTYPETATILEGVSVAGLSIEAISVIRNLHTAWGYVLSTLERQVDLGVICTINALIGADNVVPSAGCIRK